MKEDVQGEEATEINHDEEYINYGDAKQVQWKR